MNEIIIDKQKFIKEHVLVCHITNRKIRTKSLRGKGKFYSLHQSKRRCALNHWRKANKLK